MSKSLKQKLMGTLSFLLVITFLLPMFTNVLVYAEPLVDEATEEAIEDSQASIPTRAGDWSKAINEDGFAWNAFHIAVQNDIRGKHVFVGRSELPIDFRNENGDLTGKKGKADLYRRENEDDPESTTYLWEVKPASYSIEPKLTKGLIQLQGYINSKTNYTVGGIDIMSGSCTLGNYTITYENAGNGLIFYWFERNEEEKEPEPEPEPELEPGDEPIVIPGGDKKEKEPISPPFLLDLLQ